MQAGDKNIKTLPLSDTNFNPRPHAGGDVQHTMSLLRQGIFQSTPPHGGRLCSPSHLPGRRHFNPRPHAGGDPIPAPTARRGMISIHAPTRGATIVENITIFGVTDFNPRPHAGGDARSRIGVPFARDISIHAPTRGATVRPTTMMGPKRFQSTPPRGGRRSSTPQPSAQCYFNPRPHAGGDESAGAVITPELHNEHRKAVIRYRH